MMQMKKVVIVAILLLSTFAMESAVFPVAHPIPVRPTAADPAPGAANAWVDSVFRSLSPEERIAQLIFIRAYGKQDPGHIRQVEQLIKEQKVGGLVFFQGSPVQQAVLTNRYQNLSKVPLFISMDAEWGLGMRLDSVLSFPHQMMLGAINDSMMIYEVGKRIGAQCKRLGVQIDFAPVVDINNNPDNPVINDRSFGENKFRVARWGVQYMRGLQSEGVMAVAKHFPGHGDTDVDSHKALPVIHKPLDALRQLELFPFQQMINYGVPGIMVAHLEIPAIDSRAHRPMSISEKAVNGLLKKNMGFQGLVFTDALEMKGVSDYYGNGRAGVEALKAGNDILLLPADVDACIRRVQKAVATGELQMASINKRVKKVLMAKYHAGLADLQPIETAHLTEDLNQGVMALTRELDIRAITVLNNENHLLPLDKNDRDKIALLTVGGPLAPFVDRVKMHHPVQTFAFSFGQSMQAADQLAAKLKKNFDKVVIAVGDYHRYPAGRYGLSSAAIQLIEQLQDEKRTVVFAFGNPYAIKYFAHGPTTVAAYNDAETMQQTAADLLFGAFDPEGSLPVTVSREFPSGTGLQNLSYKKAYLPFQYPSQMNISDKLLKRVDSIAKDAIARKATPGCEILAMKDGKIFYHKAFGHFTYNKQDAVQKNTIYDLASVTKVCATTIACMRLYDQGKLSLDGTLGDYLPWLRGTDKAGLTIKDVMLHQAGFVPDFYYGSFLNEEKRADTTIFHQQRDARYTVHVARNLYMRADYLDTIKALIRDSKLDKTPDYVYSDIDFQLMGYIVEEITGLPLNEYIKRSVYDSIGMVSTGFKPRQRFALDRIAPTECEKNFRAQCLHGDVHDPRSAMTGGVAGHAGLFSDAYDLGVLLQMLVNRGVFAGKRYLKASTVELFTSYQSDISRRGIGWDKREKEVSESGDTYPSPYCSEATFGHYGYTGTAVWADPKYNFVYVFLSNRVNPRGGANTILQHLNVRSKVQDAFYVAMGVGRLK